MKEQGLLPAEIRVLDLGVMPFEQAFLIQKEIHASVCNGTSPPTLLMLEHPSVYTLGKNARSQMILSSDNTVPVYRIDRGGEVTAHNEGQLVVYPILPLARWRLGVRDYVCSLEKSLIETLSYFGLIAETCQGFPGVWLEGRRKIAAVGIRVKDRVTMHGISVNISNDLAIFEGIVPCGISGKQVTSLSKELGRPVYCRDFKSPLLGCFSKYWNCEFKLASDRDVMEVVKHHNVLSSKH